MSSSTRQVATNWILSKEHQNSELTDWVSTPEELISSAEPISFQIGTGSQLLSSVFSKCAALTENEVIITTCFWSKSSSQKSISSLLSHLSAKAQRKNSKIYVRICFSSLSLSQKLFQTSSHDGKYYSAASWPKINLPPQTSLKGLDMVVKSIFFRPLSVMHPKFIIVDRRRVFIPSCNVSWENWFEGCIELKGDIVMKVFYFWQKTWFNSEAEQPSFSAPSFNEVLEEDEARLKEYEQRDHNAANSMPKELVFSRYSQSILAILLPSSHHINLRLNHCLCSINRPPPTPLNNFLLYIFSIAKSSIFIQTANFTSSPVISALISALSRGVNVHVITNRHLMILEQLLTAGTTTSLSVRKFQRKYRSILCRYTKTSHNEHGLSSPAPGKLRIGYYDCTHVDLAEKEPSMNHLKLGIVDSSILVLGSGNMDRASWYTSQELGVAFLDEGLTQAIQEIVHDSLRNRVKYICS